MSLHSRLLSYNDSEVIFPSSSSFSSSSSSSSASSSASSSSSSSDLFEKSYLINFTEE